MHYERNVKISYFNSCQEQILKRKKSIEEFIFMIFCQITVQDWSPVKILSEYEKLQENKSLATSISSKNTALFLECASVLLPGVAERSAFASAVAIHVPLWKNKFDLSL